MEAIRDPLTHLIRNAVDHGIEKPEGRVAKGKNEEGRLSIKAYHEGGQVTIEIKDDGNGIDPERILNKAIQKNIISAEQASRLSTKQILNLIFMPGFSTAEQVTNISGRGVGMDVVKSNIERIGGSVDTSSQVGEGTTFKLKIPLTLAIVPALVVQTTQETFAIPQINLVELVRLDKEDEGKIEKLHDSEFYRLRGELIPVFRLRDHLKISAKKNAKVEIENLYGESINIVILNAEGRVYGLIVDHILDTEEIVVKPLSRKLKSLTTFAGATIMGDGSVALIVDALGFLNSVDKGSSGGRSSGIEIDQLLKSNTNEDAQELLLCKMSDSRTYAVPLLLVNRLEEFRGKQIEWTGEQPIIRYRDLTMPLINVEKSLHLGGQSLIEKAIKDPELVVPCIVVKMKGHYFGIVVEAIQDIALGDSTINAESVDRDGFLGTIFVGKRTITVIDIHSLVMMQKVSSIFSDKNLKLIKRGKVLLVEDSPLYQKVQNEILTDNGYEVIIASNGLEALDILKKDQDFSAIVTDIEMPQMDGWEFVKELKKMGGIYLKIPVIGVSSKVNNRDKEKGALEGFNQYIEKLNKNDVLNALQLIDKR